MHDIMSFAINVCAKKSSDRTLCCLWECRYVPNHRLQYEYPDNYDAAVQQSCLDDSNVLEGPETDEEQFLFGPQHHGGEDESKAECGRDYH